MGEKSDAAGSANPTECDLVMKGGITSGVVYPLAIVEIAKAFRLRSIGGTSAGAIAAAGAAAAQAGKLRGEKSGSPRGGFALLAELPAYLSAAGPVGGRTGLQGLFRPHPAIASLFYGLTAAMGVKGKGARCAAYARCLLRASWLFLLTGVILWATLQIYTFGTPQTPGSYLWMVGGGLIGGAALSAIVLTVRVAGVLWRNRFGLCSGMPQPGDSDAVAGQCLTVWLAHYLDTLSLQADTQGLAENKPLTFGDLSALKIDLQMMTTCLSHGRPYRLPFRDEEKVRENKQFYYKEEEFRALFPGYVVDWMVRHQRPPSVRQQSLPEDGYLRLPEPADLPVVVAARMSLSFPILLSAIPLYARDYQQRVPRLERCWFSDGGLTANFPIHFFDAPLPSRPTFGLNLGKVSDPAAPRVCFPANNGAARQFNWSRFESGSRFRSLFGFVATLINTMQSWSDETQARLPGYRDRIAVILLTEEEGGLNLSMPAERITALANYGRVAGEGFVRRFAATGERPEKMNWDNHQLIRLRSLIASVSEMLLALKQGDDALRTDPRQRYERFFSPLEPEHSSYRFQGRDALHQPGQPYQSQARLAEHLLGDLLALAEEIAAAGSAADPQRDAPKPPPELKMKPRI